MTLVKDTLEDDLMSFIQLKKKNLLRDKVELQNDRVPPQTSLALDQPMMIQNDILNKSENSHLTLQKMERKNNKDESGGWFLKIGDSEEKKRKLNEERRKEYQRYLSQKEGRSCAGKKSTSPKKTQRRQEIQEYKANVDETYAKMLKGKREDEIKYRAQFDAPDKKIGPRNKKIIELDSDEEELFRYVINQEKHRQRSAEARIKRDSDNLKNESRNENRSNSLPLVFGGVHHDDVDKQRNDKYRRELEEQIKEKELTRTKERLKKQGRITSDTNISEFLSQTTKPLSHSCKETSTSPANPEIQGNAMSYPYPPMFMNTYPNTFQAAPPFQGWVPPPGTYTTPPFMGYVPVQYPIESTQQLINQNIVSNQKGSAPQQNYSTKSYKPQNNAAVVNNKTPSASAAIFGCSPPSSHAFEVKRQRQHAYQEELKKQMEEKRLATEKDKAEYERYEKKLEAEIATYDPWGKGGAGAPMRTFDASFTDDQLKGNGVEISPLMQAVRKSLSDNERSPNHMYKEKYTRGAALRELQGVADMSPLERCQQEDYKTFLKLQVEEKKKKEGETKQLARLEEEKQNAKLLEQQKQMKEEFRREKEKQRQKEEELRKQNEELRLFAEQKRHKEECEMKRLKEDEDRIRQQEAEKRLKLSPSREALLNRGESPPVPAVAKVTKRTKQTKRRSKDGSLTLQKHENDGDVEKKMRRSVVTENENSVRRSNDLFDETTQSLLHQLSNMRVALKEKESNIRLDLQRNKEKYSNLLDRSTVNIPNSHADMFGEGIAIHTSKPHLAELNGTLNFLHRSDDEDLDAKQRAYIKLQEERLKALREKLEYHVAKQPPRFTSGGSNKSLLDCDTKFLTMNGVTVQPHETDKRNDSTARSRRREAQREASLDSTSMDTIKLDNIDEKNRMRLEKLHHEGGLSDDLVDVYAKQNNRGQKNSEVSLPSDTYFTGFKER